MVETSLFLKELEYALDNDQTKEITSIALKIKEMVERKNYSYPDETLAAARLNRQVMRVAAKAYRHDQVDVADLLLFNFVKDFNHAAHNNESLLQILSKNSRNVKRIDFAIKKGADPLYSPKITVQDSPVVISLEHGANNVFDLYCAHDPSILKKPINGGGNYLVHILIKKKLALALQRTLHKIKEVGGTDLSSHQNENKWNSIHTLALLTHETHIEEKVMGTEHTKIHAMVDHLESHSPAEFVKMCEAANRSNKTPLDFCRNEDQTIYNYLIEKVGKILVSDPKLSPISKDLFEQLRKTESEKNKLAMQLTDKKTYFGKASEIRVR
ncbi:MAG: hypothetical protein KGH53_00535 [Candidatus Micrarchaeota archaeon]|nr:hypothetical protein [Candidatus Micrarchaeota archaeon]